MAGLDNLQKVTEIDLGFQKADYVSPKVDEEHDDKDADTSKLAFAWFRIESKLVPSQIEEQERIEAIKHQFENKIINKYGFPYGAPMPKEVKEIIKQQEQGQKHSKFDRQRQRTIDRQIQKDMDRARKTENTNPIFRNYQ
jgi:hypothetical protein